jgi:hypothetical protein
MARMLKPNRYCAIFVADYRIARSRVILPLHADVIGLMQRVALICSTSMYGGTTVRVGLDPSARSPIRR